MKKIIAGLVSAALALGCLALPAEVAEKLDSVITASAATYGDFEYTVLDDGTVEISDYNGSDTSITIPSSIKGKSVSTIGSYAFLDCTEIKSITIPDSVTSIEMGAFEDCAYLTSITIPDSVTTIETAAFRYCMRLKSITLPKNLTCIDAYLFYECSALTSVKIPSKVDSIDSSAFENCKSLASITIPSKVTSIGYDAFNGCTSLTSITIPDSVTEIGRSAFSDCTNLSSVSIPESITEMGKDAFENTPWFTAKLKNSPLVIESGVLLDGSTASGKVTVPSTVRVIAQGAFAAKYNSKTDSYTSWITSVKIPSGVTEIGYGAFSHCENLTTVNIPSTVSVINFHTFEYCLSLTNVTIGEGVFYITSFAFDHCESLEGISLPSGITKIDMYAFNHCTSLKSIVIPDGVYYIPSGTFRACESLESVTIPEGVQRIDNEAFAYCAKLKSVKIPSTVTSIGDEAFTGCSSIKSIAIPSGVTSIGICTFENCSSLTSVTIPKSVTAIEDCAFSSCNNIKNVYYTGSQSDWNNISIADNNTALNSATIHYNYLTNVTVPTAKISQTYTSTGTSFTLNWGKLSGVTGYIVHKYDGANSKWVKVKTVAGASNTSTTVTGFTPGSVIKFKVTAYKTINGNTYYGTTNDYLYAAALANAKISQSYSSTGTSYTLNWGKVTGATGYKVYKYNGSTGKWVLVKTVKGANTLSTTVSGITPGSVIKFKVNAYLTKGSTTYYGKTKDFLYAAALAPASLKSSYTATTTTAAVSWNKVSGATGYKIYKYDSANKKWVLAKTVTSASTTSATVTGLKSKTTTKLKVNAYLTKGTKTYYGKAGTMLSVTTK